MSRRVQRALVASAGLLLLQLWLATPATAQNAAKGDAPDASGAQPKPAQPKPAAPKPAAAPAAPSYKRAVDAASALLDAGKYEAAVGAYSKIMVGQRQACSAPPDIDDAAKLARTSPCWRMLAMQFNIALTRKRQANATKRLDAYRTYMTNWRAAFPKVKTFPLIERATYEVASAQFQLGRHVKALRNYRSALTMWRKRHRPARRAKFADDAKQHIAECLEKLGARKPAAAAYEAFLTQYKKHHGKPHPVADVLRARVRRLRAPRVVSTPTNPGSAKRGRALRVSGWIASGLGVASLASGVVFGVLAAKKQSNIEAADKLGTEDFEDYRSDVSRGETYQAVQIATLIAGGAVLATGIALLVAGYAAPASVSERRVVLVPTLWPGGAAISGMLRF